MRDQRPMQDAFFVKWIDPMKRARIHRANCADCREGRGQLGHRQAPAKRQSGWYGPFDLKAALEIAESLRLNGYRDTGLCHRCMPKAST
jgi:hypothetical protein